MIDMVKLKQRYEGGELYDALYTAIDALESIYASDPGPAYRIAKSALKEIAQDLDLEENNNG